MYESEVLKIVKESVRFLGNAKESRVKRVFQQSPQFAAFVNHLEGLVNQKSFGVTNEASFMLDFIIKVCDDNMKLNDKVIKYAKKYGLE